LGTVRITRTVEELTKDGAMNKKELDSGWTVEGGEIYHFKHVDQGWAFNELERRSDLFYAVEVIHGIGR
jgi:hypothetical protein